MATVPLLFSINVISRRSFNIDFPYRRNRIYIRTFSHFSLSSIFRISAQYGKKTAPRIRFYSSPPHTRIMYIYMKRLAKTVND